MTVHSKVQLLQKQHKGSSEAQRQALVQVRNIVRHVSPKFPSVMQKDLFDMLGEFKGMDQQKDFSKTITTGSFLGEVFLPKREAAVFAQSIKSEESGPGGAAAGSKS